MKQRPLFASSLIAFIFSTMLMLLLSCENSSPSGESNSVDTMPDEPSWMADEETVSMPLTIASPLNNDKYWAAYMQRTYVETYAGKVLHTADGGYVISANSYLDLWMIRFSSENKIVWQKKYRLTEIGYTYPDITQTHDGGFLLSGCYSDYNQSDRIIFMKVDADGNFAWSRIYKYSVMDFNPQVVSLPDGSVIAAASIQPVGDGDGDILLFRIDGEGNPVWSKQFRGGAGFEFVYDAALCKDGNIIVAGTTNNPALPEGYLPVHTFVIKVTPSGEMLWDRKYSYTGSLNHPEFGVRSVKALPDGGFIIAGELAYFKKHILGAEYSARDMWVVKCDADGNSIWNKRFRNMLSSPDYYSGLDSAEYNDGLYSAAVTADGNILLQGSSTSTFKREAGFNGYYLNYLYEKWDYAGWIIKLTSGGRVLFTKGYRDPAQTRVTNDGLIYEKLKSNSIYLNCMDLTVAGDIIAAGSVNIGPYRGKTSLLLFKADQDGKIGDTTMTIKNLSPSVMSIPFTVTGIDSTYTDISPVSMDSSVRELVDTDYTITGM